MARAGWKECEWRRTLGEVVWAEGRLERVLHARPRFLRYRLHFERDSREEVERRRKVAREQVLQPVSAEVLELDIREVYQPGSGALGAGGGGQSRENPRRVGLHVCIGILKLSPRLAPQSWTFPDVHLGTMECPRSS